MSSGVGVASHMVISFGTDNKTLLFISFNPYSETFSAFSHTCIDFLLVGQVKLYISRPQHNTI